MLELIHRHQPVLVPLCEKHKEIVTSAATTASAETCQQRANNCVGKGGKPADCHDPQRLAQCKRIGQYTASSGTVGPATAENTDSTRKGR
jgi:hypothetical protein